MSRIGKKPIPLPASVKYTVQGNTVLVEGPKGKLTAMLPTGITLEKKDGTLLAVREKEELAALHGLTRALVSNAVEGVTKGWTKELDKENESVFRSQRNGIRPGLPRYRFRMNCGGLVSSGRAQRDDEAARV